MRIQGARGHRGLSCWWAKLVRRARTYHLNFPRLLNYVLSQFSWRARRRRSLGGPRVLWIEPTNACNLECPICPTGAGTLGRGKTRMSFQQFKELVDARRDTLLRLVFSGYGEPFINPATLDMIEYAHKHGIVTEVYSNLLLVNDDTIRRIVRSGLEEIVVAIDVASQGNSWRYVKKTAESIERVKERLTRLMQIRRELGRSTPFVRVTYPLTKENEPLVEEARRLAEDAGVDAFSIKTVNATIAGTGFKKLKQKWIPDGFDRYARPVNGHGRCPWPYGGGLVYANGDLAPCCHLGRGEHVLGNVFGPGGFSRVWNGKDYEDFRRMLMECPESDPVCGPCRERFNGM